MTDKTLVHICLVNDAPALVIAHRQTGGYHMTYFQLPFGKQYWCSFEEFRLTAKDLANLKLTDQESKTAETILSWYDDEHNYIAAPGITTFKRWVQSL